MILNTTYLDKEKVTINNLVGKKLFFLDCFIKNSGIGSHRMIIEEHSDKFNNHFKSNNTFTCSLEIRNKGLIVRISINYETISWLFLIINYLFITLSILVYILLTILLSFVKTLIII